MEIQIMNEVYSIQDQLSSSNDVIDKIDDLLQKHKLILVGMEVDGVILHDHYEEYLNNKLKEIKYIYLNVQTKEQLKKEMSIELENYLKRAIPAVTDLAEDFYYQPSNETWDSFIQFLDGLNWIIVTLEFINDNNYSENLINMKGHFLELKEALDNKDTIIIGDLLNYEYKPQYEELIKKLIN